MADESLSCNSKDENFIRTIKENVTTPLIMAHFQPTPSLEAFNQVVLDIEKLVDIGRITTVHELEIALIGSARVRLPFK
jgi:hypothetical protein